VMDISYEIRKVIKLCQIHCDFLVANMETGQYCQLLPLHGLLPFNNPGHESVTDLVVQ